MSAYASQAETNCWSRLKNDDPQALSYFYDQYVDGLFLTAMAITKDRELAKDALQEVFIELWNYRKTVNEVRNTKAYLTSILKSVIFRKKRRLQAITDHPDLSDMPEETMNREEAIIASDLDNEKRSRLQQAMAGLSKKQQLILKLRFHENMTYDEIADKLGMKYQSVNNLVFRVFRRLRGTITHLLSVILLLS